MTVQTPARSRSLADQLAAVVAVLEQSSYAPSAAAARALRRIQYELADRETLILNLADVWRDIARREWERARREQGASYQEGYAVGGAAAYGDAAAQLEQWLELAPRLARLDQCRKRKEDAR